MPLHRMVSTTAGLSRRGSPLSCKAGVDALVARSWDLRFHDPAGSLASARRAYLLATAGRVEPLVQASAAAEAGNAARRFGRWAEAGRLLTEAARLARPDRSLAARVESYRGSLYQSRRLWRSAHAALDRAEAIYNELHDEPGTMKVAIQRGIAWIEAGEPERARPVLAGVVAKAPTSDLARFAAQPFIWAALESGDAERAAWFFRLLQPVMAGGQPLYAHRVEWLRGKLTLALGALADARSALCPLRAAFASAGLVQEAALVGLDLALVEVHAGRPLAVQSAVAGCAPLFGVLGLHREFLASKILAVATAPAATAALLAEAARRVRALPSYLRH